MYRFITSLTLVLCLNAFGQTQQIDKRLLARYSTSELKAMQKNDPKEYQFLVNALDKGIFIADIPAEKAKDIVWDGVLKIDPNSHPTFISLNKQILDRYQRFKIEGTNKMLSILPRIFLESKTTK